MWSCLGNFRVDVLPLTHSAQGNKYFVSRLLWEWMIHTWCAFIPPSASSRDVACFGCSFHFTESVLLHTDTSAAAEIKLSVTSVPWDDEFASGLQIWILREPSSLRWLTHNHRFLPCEISITCGTGFFFLLLQKQGLCCEMQLPKEMSGCFRFLASIKDVFGVLFRVCSVL